MWGPCCRWGRCRTPWGESRPGAVGVVYLDGGGAQPDGELRAGEGGVGGVQVAAPLADGDLPLLVGRPRYVGHALEPAGGQPEKGEAVLLKQLLLGLALDPAGLRRQRHALVQQLLVVRFHAANLGHGHEQVAPDRADLVLDVALLVAGVGVAEAVAESVVRAARLERLGGANLVADLAPDARGVVEHDLDGHSAEVLEYVAQGLADALGVLAGEHLDQAHVGEGERENEEVEPGANAVQVEIGFPEVRLRLAGRPGQVEMAIGPPGALELRALHVALDRAEGDVGRAFADEPVVNALRRVAPLMEVARVVVQPLVDDGLVGVDLGMRRPLLREGRAEIFPVPVFLHGVAGDALISCDFRDALAAPPSLAYRILLGHADHFLSGPP